MKKSGRIFGAIILGMALMAGCGDEQAAVALNGQPVELTGNGTEGNGQNGQGQGSQEQDGRTQGQSDSEQSGERIKLTLGVVMDSTSPAMQNLVEAYNAQSDKYYVEMAEYLPENYDNAIFEASEDRFRMDLATGKGTDIVLFGGLSADELGYAGVVLDLNSFLYAEDKVGEEPSGEKYLFDILKCAQTGDALYEISPAFTLGFIVGDGSRLGMENGWTMEEMMESFERNGRDGLALAQGQGRTVERLVEASIEDYVDWDAGTADFCKEEFYRVLEFGKATDSSEYIRPSRESATAGIHLASCEGLGTAADIQYFKWLFGDNAAVKGWPCSHGTGITVGIQQYSMGICSYSKCPEGAWDFLEFFVDAAWTEREFEIEGELIKKNFSNYFGGFPVNRQLFEKMLAQSMVQQYYPDTGNPIPLLQGEGEIPDFYANTAEDVEKLRELIALADRRYLPDQSVICQIIGEEIGGYNAGVLTAEQTAQKIQNRGQLYLDEQK